MINGSKRGVPWVGKDLWWGVGKLTSSYNTPLLGIVFVSLFILSTRAPFFVRKDILLFREAVLQRGKSSH